jgi:D-alanine--D-alanine ligase
VIKIAVRGDLDRLEDELSSYSPRDTFIFNNCDGFNGDNMGAVQVIRVVERMGFAHSGSTAETVQLCIDKPRAKDLLQRSGVPTPKFQVFEKAKGAFALEFPVIVKPSKQGSTVGLSIVRSGSELQAAIDEAFNFDDEVMVEAFIAGRELTVGILGDVALPVGEIIPKHEIYDYECKYTAGMADERFPAELTHEEARRVEFTTATGTADLQGRASRSRKSGADMVDVQRLACRGREQEERIGRRPGYSQSHFRPDRRCGTLCDSPVRASVLR